MECISLALASTTCCFHPIAVKSSAYVSAHRPSFAFSLCRGVLACKSTQCAVAAAAAAAVTDVGIGAAEPSSVSSVIPKKVLVPIGYGTEEMEAVIMVHVLRQAGAHVTVASVESQLEVEASSGLKLIADTLINSCTDEIYDLIALPGGMPGSVRLRDCETLRTITSKHAEEKRLYGAICAAPAVTLLPWGLLKRKQTTCHPAFMDKLSSFWAVKSNIKVSGELTTSRGPGTAFEFALSLAGQLVGESVAQEVQSSLLLNTEDCLRKELNRVEWFFDQLPQALIPVADGCEEIEIVTIVDVLRRANVNVVIASVGKSRQIVASQGTKIIADNLINVAAESTYDLIALPGGLKGSNQLSKSKVLKNLLKEQESSGRMYGAVSSSLALLEKEGLLKDKTVATGSPVSAKSTSKVCVEDAKVVIDGKLITSKGLGTTVDFALAIVSKLFGHARARSVAEGLVFEYPRR